mmetsp:Transcript_43871/g.66348  ORF Transcript_43871/g.66348 Transcript_43871/m.66348 type:complete len:86 (+) Transcript_43871:85-342(+)
MSFPANACDSGLPSIPRPGPPTPAQDSFGSSGGASNTRSRLAEVCLHETFGRRQGRSSRSRTQKMCHCGKLEQPLKIGKSLTPQY